MRQIPSRSETVQAEGGNLARFRYRTSALTGRWRETRAAASADAVRAGQALPDARGEHGLRWLVPGEIEDEEDEIRNVAVGGR